MPANLSDYNPTLATWFSKGIFANTTGAAMSASRTSRPFLENVIGVADIETEEPLSLEHRYNIASQTKTVTALAMTQLATKGIVSFDDSVSNYVPALKKVSKEHRSITLEHLLMHTAGLPRDIPPNDYWEGTLPFPTEERLVAAVQENPLVFSPGEKMKYTNIGYALLGMVIANVTDTPYRQYIQKAIIEPLELPSMSFTAEHSEYPLARGYGVTPSSSNSFPAFDSGAYAPAAGLWANVRDVRRLFEVFLPTSENAQKRIGLDVKTLNQMTVASIAVDNSGGVEYGLGVDIGYDGNNRIIGHGGGSPGYRSGTAIDTEQGLVVSTFVNQINHDAFMDSILIVNALRYIIQNTSERTVIPSDHQQLLRNAWGYKSTFSLGDRLAVINPASLSPFTDDSVELLEPASDAMYKIIRANAFEPLGEKVDFSSIDSGIVDFAGRTMRIER